ncbi:hypothetical protein CK203_079211 [Vitis vinifera]|uniref:Uncharacterized protein n=1 Tax=Vitis vinifera TaxID=29760 RepID=A0A438DYS4_VITVI|nr:hypothetical protein CK203_079211 [Vitis vinifera]
MRRWTLLGMWFGPRGKRGGFVCLPNGFVEFSNCLGMLVLGFEKEISSLLRKLESKKGCGVKCSVHGKRKGEGCGDLTVSARAFQPPWELGVGGKVGFSCSFFFSCLPLGHIYCRVEDLLVNGLIEGSIIHIHRARTIIIDTDGMISASELGCRTGIGKGNYSNGAGGGAGHGGRGGSGLFHGRVSEGGDKYGSAELPCELGSGN